MRSPMHFHARPFRAPTVADQPFKLDTLPPNCAFAAWMVGHVALAFIARSDREPILRYGLFSNVVMNLWAVAAVGLALLAIYLPPLREVLRFGEVTPRDLLISAGLALLLITPAELWKVFRSSSPPPTNTMLRLADLKAP